MNGEAGVDGRATGGAGEAGVRGSAQALVLRMRMERRKKVAIIAVALRRGDMLSILGDFTGTSNVEGVEIL